MNKYLKLMTNKTKLKCAGIIALAMISSVLASIWPVKLGELYTDISGGKINGVAQGIVAIATFGLIYFSAECITILRRVLLDCIIATHEAEIRETSVEKLLKMPVSYYAGCLSGEKTAQLNQGVAGLSQLIKILCNDIVATVLTVACTLIQVVLKAPLAMAGIMLLYLATTLLVSVFQIRSQNGIRENIIKQKNSLEGQICQSISNLELIRSMDAEEYERIRLQPVIHKVSATEKKHHRYMGSFDCVKQFCKIAFQVIKADMAFRPYRQPDTSDHMEVHKYQEHLPYRLQNQHHLSKEYTSSHSCEVEAYFFKALPIVSLLTGTSSTIFACSSSKRSVHRE